MASASVPAGAHRLSRDDARRLAVRAALLDAERPGDVVEVAEQLLKIKIDPTATILTSEHAMLWARIGWSYDHPQLSKAVEIDRLLFEYDGTFRPISALPAMLPIMRTQPRYAKAREWFEQNARFRTEVLAALRDRGPLRASEIDDTAQVAGVSESGWYGSNQVPRMLEALMRRGDVAVVRREGRQKVWDLAERVFPADLPELTLAEGEEELQQRRLRAAGIARPKTNWAGVGLAGEPAVVDGVTGVWRVDPEALALLDDDPGGRVALLNPYDTTLFDRPRLRDLFGFDYTLEQFKPAAERRFGYFCYPILVGERFVGQMDAAIDRSDDGAALRVANIHETTPVGERGIDDEEWEMIRAEIRDLGEWLGIPVRGLE